MVPQFLSRPCRLRSCKPALALALLPMLAGCDRLKSALQEPATGDPVWQADSSLIAKAPPMLFRVLRKQDGDQVLPIATIGEKGFQPLYLSNRGVARSHSSALRTRFPRETPLYSNAHRQSSCEPNIYKQSMIASGFVLRLSLGLLICIPTKSKIR